MGMNPNCSDWRHSGTQRLYREGKTPASREDQIDCLYIPAVLVLSTHEDMSRQGSGITALTLMYICRMLPSSYPPAQNLTNSAPTVSPPAKLPEAPLVQKCAGRFPIPMQDSSGASHACLGAAMGEPLTEAESLAARRTFGGGIIS